MGISYSQNWADYSNGHLAKEATATALIKNAAAALNGTDQMELILWATAANSPASSEGTTGQYLDVFKGDHQAVGIFDAESHLTCAVWNKKKYSKERSSMPGGAFHLYFKALDPALGKTKYELEITRISYTNLEHVIKEFAVNGAAKVSSDK